MKHRSGKIFAVLLIYVLAGMIRMPGAAFANAGVSGREKTITVKLVNKTDANIFFACSMLLRANPCSNDGSQGWWKVEPGRKRTVTILKHQYGGPNDYKYGFYAISPARGRVWAGAKEKGMNAGEFWIHPKASFASQPDFPSFDGGKEFGRNVLFRPMVMGRDYSTTITFTDKEAFTGKQRDTPVRPPKRFKNANAAIRGSLVNIRQAPSLRAQVLLQLKDGEGVWATGRTATSDAGKWFQIKTPSGQIGWVFGRYVSIW